MEDYAINRNKILNAPEAGDEGGMMKCMFHVQDRYIICRVLASEDKEEFETRLSEAIEGTIASTDVEATWYLEFGFGFDLFEFDFDFHFDSMIW